MIIEKNWMNEKLLFFLLKQKEEKSFFLSAVVFFFLIIVIRAVFAWKDRTTVSCCLVKWWASLRASLTANSPPEGHSQHTGPLSTNNGNSWCEQAEENSIPICSSRSMLRFLFNTESFFLFVCFQIQNSAFIDVYCSNEKRNYCCNFSAGLNSFKLKLKIQIQIQILIFFFFSMQQQQQWIQSDWNTERESRRK